MLLKHLTSNHLSDTEFKDFMKLYKDYAKQPFSFLMNYTTLSSDNPLELIIKWLLVKKSE